MQQAQCTADSQHQHGVTQSSETGKTGSYPSAMVKAIMRIEYALDHPMIRDARQDEIAMETQPSSDELSDSSPEDVADHDRFIASCIASAANY